MNGKNLDRVLRACSRIALAVNLLLTALLTYHILRTGRAFAKIFADFGSSLPPLTWFALSCWYPWILPVLALFGVAKEWILKKPRAALIWNGVHFAMAIAVWGLFVDLVFGQLVGLIERLSR
jgi:hypothetical protein